jgi:protein-tyrosine phosphatase
MDNRVWTLEGVHNFRDFGGYATSDGSKVVAGRLYRSAHFAEASAADLERLNALDARAVIDLRRPEERVRDPNRWPGARAETISNDEGQVELPPHVAVLMQTDLTPESVAHFMHTSYGHYPFEARYRDLYRRFFHLFLETERPVVIHCAAGKDRTGVGCALVLSALGVPRDVVFADYEMTNTVVDVEARLPIVQATMAERLGRTVATEALRPMIGVRADYLAAAFASIEAQSGSLDAYLEEHLGIGPAERAQLRERLVV